MLRCNGARLAYWLGLNSLGSKLDDDSSITLNKSLGRGNSREFGSGICNSSRLLGNSENGNQNDGLWFGVSHYGLDLKSLFHGTELKYMAAKDYYDILGTSMNASASEFLKAYYEEHQIEKIRFDIEKMRVEQRKDLENLHGELRPILVKLIWDFFSPILIVGGVIVGFKLCLWLFGLISMYS